MKTGVCSVAGSIPSGKSSAFGISYVVVGLYRRGLCGVAELMSSFFAAMSADLPQWCLNQRAGAIPLVLARYGADAGLAGAGALSC